MRLPNKAKPQTNNQKDNTVIEGIITTDQLYENMKTAGINLQEQLKKMYPKNEDLEKKELEMIADEKLRQQFYNADMSNKEKIDMIFTRKETNKAIANSIKNIDRLQKEIAENERKINEEILKYENESLKKEIDSKS